MITLVILNGRILAEGADHDYTLTGNPGEEVPVFNVLLPPKAVVQVIQFDGGASERQDVYDTPPTEQGKTVIDLQPGNPGVDVKTVVHHRRKAADFTLSKRT